MTIINCTVIKSVISITTEELYRNYIRSVTDVVWSQKVINARHILADPVNNILIENEDDITNMFRNGNTELLLGGIDKDFENADYREIVITRRDGSIFCVHDADIEWWSVIHIINSSIE